MNTNRHECTRLIKDHGLLTTDHLPRIDETTRYTIAVWADSPPLLERGYLFTGVRLSVLVFGGVTMWECARAFGVRELAPAFQRRVGAEQRASASTPARQPHSGP